MKKIIPLFLLSVFLISFQACTTVKGYQKVYVNDDEMKVQEKDCAHFESYFQIIREGASGAGGGKTGGGCGCN